MPKPLAVEAEADEYSAKEPANPYPYHARSVLLLCNHGDGCCEEKAGGGVERAGKRESLDTTSARGEEPLPRVSRTEIDLGDTKIASKIGATGSMDASPAGVLS